jgi:hypothetical protein
LFAGGDHEQIVEGIWMKFAALALAVSVALSGCATARIEVLGTGEGPGPTDARSYAFTATQPEGAVLRPLVEDQFRSRGFVRTEAAAPRYFVELGYSARPAGVGAYALAAPAKDDPSGWIAPPARPRPWTSTTTRICVLSVRLIDARTGAEAYRVTATERRRKGDCTLVAPALVSAALSEIPFPKTTGKARKGT